MATVTLPTGKKITISENKTINSIAAEHANTNVVAALVDKKLVDRSYRVNQDDCVELLGQSSERLTEVVRNTATLIVANALDHCGITPVSGTWSDDGFYYDVDGEVDSDVLNAVEERATGIISSDTPIKRFYESSESVLKRYEDNRYKQELIHTKFDNNQPIPLVGATNFVDIREGPYLESTGKIAVVELTGASAAYWRGNADNEQLTRIHGIAFGSISAYKKYKKKKQRADERDHRRLARDLDLFSIPDHAPGAVRFHPNGMIVRKKLVSFLREVNRSIRYREVETPEYNEVKLWTLTGHRDHFSGSDFFTWQAEDTNYGLKPINCASHAKLFEHSPRSYRDLPVRYAEFGKVHRGVRSGELSGMLRVRAFTQDDGHAFLRPDQLEDEVAAVIEAIERVLETFNLRSSFRMETKPPDSKGEPALWEEATGAMKDALSNVGVEYEVADGDGAFYGPKVSAIAEDALERRWPVGTVQLDIVLPERMDLSYKDRHGEPSQPFVLHRALIGSFERFLAILLEHFNGQFPPWLAPEQVRLLPVEATDQEYAESVATSLPTTLVSVTDATKTLSQRIRAAHDDRVPYMIIVGNDERCSGTISVRDRQERTREDVDPTEFADYLATELDERQVRPTVVEHL